MPRKQKQAHKTDPIEDKALRVNIKSKRKRTLLRKAIEVSKLCNLQILIIIQDNESNKIIEYNSGKSQLDHFSLERAIQIKQSNAFSHIFYNDTSYNDLTPNQKRMGLDQLEINMHKDTLALLEQCAPKVDAATSILPPFKPTLKI